MAAIEGGVSRAVPVFFARPEFLSLLPKIENREKFENATGNFACEGFIGFFIMKKINFLFFPGLPACAIFRSS